MLYSVGHGHRTYLKKTVDNGMDAAGAPTTSVLEFSESDIEKPEGSFGYFFPDVPGVEHSPDIAAKLEALATAMIEQKPDDTDINASISPIYTYFGQFIGHDVVANAGLEASSPINTDDALIPVERKKLSRDLLNLCDGSLRLNSLYGDRPCNGEFSNKLRKLMRFPADQAKMRLGAPVAIANQKSHLPTDKASDLLRINKIMSDDPGHGITLNELRAQPTEVRCGFLDGDENLIPQRAVIGDARNDENLNIAQLQVAFLRFHNRTVDWLRESGMAEYGSDKLFRQARQLLKWHYQWLIVNDYLKKVCREDMLEFVISQEAGLYKEFYNRRRSENPDKMPIPLEFSVAAFRFGHSMVRSDYDFNRFYGSPVAGFENHVSSASLDMLFSYTGRSPNPMPIQTAAGGQYEALPSNWVIDWDRFVGNNNSGSKQSTRKIDTRLSPPLENIPTEMMGIFKRIGNRDLRRGHQLSIPCAQACVSEYNSVSGAEISYLSKEELLSGDTGSAVADAGFDLKTPLWFYVLKEAEVRENGERLGMLGSALVAETLVGLIVHDQDSYWNAKSASAARWNPTDGVRGADQEVVNNLSAFLRFAGVL